MGHTGAYGRRHRHARQERGIPPNVIAWSIADTAGTDLSIPEVVEGERHSFGKASLPAEGFLQGRAVPGR